MVVKCIKCCHLSGEAAVVRITAACGNRDEGGHHVAGRGAVPQDLHTAPRECQVGTHFST